MAVPIVSSTLAEDVTRHAERLVAAAAGRIEVDLEQDSRVPDGPPRQGGPRKLRESFEVDRQPRRVGTHLTVKARNTAPHAVYTVEGTSPHLIVPVRARALRWETGGEVAFAKRVQHPGTTGRDWWSEALADLWPRALTSAVLIIG